MPAYVAGTGISKENARIEQLSYVLHRLHREN